MEEKIRVYALYLVGVVWMEEKNKGLCFIVGRSCMEGRKYLRQVQQSPRITCAFAHVNPAPTAPASLYVPSVCCLCSSSPSS
jgi:hypothetical protein